MGNLKPQDQEDRNLTKIMMEALTLRGLYDTDPNTVMIMTMPENGKSGNRKD